MIYRLLKYYQDQNLIVYLCHGNNKTYNFYTNFLKLIVFHPILYIFVFHNDNK